MSLHERTLKLINERNHSITYEKIANDTGLNPVWLRYFAIGKFKDPGVNKVQKLYSYLNGKDIKL